MRPSLPAAGTPPSTLETVTTAAHSPGDDGAAAVLQELAKVYATMDHHATAEAWDELLALEPRCRILENLLTRLSAFDAVHRSRLEELQRLNEGLQRQAIAARGKFLADLDRMQDGRRMRAAYSSR